MSGVDGRRVSRRWEQQCTTACHQHSAIKW